MVPITVKITCLDKGRLVETKNATMHPVKLDIHTSRTINMVPPYFSGIKKKPASSACPQSLGKESKILT